MKRTHSWTCRLAGLLAGFAVVYALATACIAEEKADDELVELVIELIGDADKDMRALGLDQVQTEARGEAATRRFAAQLSNLPPDAQAGLLRALADRRDVAARPAVLKLLSDSQQESARVAAIESLGVLGAAVDTQQLVQLLESETKSERRAARESLVQLSGRSVPMAIVDQMKHATPPSRATLIQILATRRALETVPDILRAAVDADSEVRAAAMTALGQLGRRDHIGGMLQGVLKAQSKRERAAAEKSVMFVCARIEDPEKRALPLLAATRKLNETDRIALLPTLGRVGGQEALGIIERAIADRDPATHKIGLRAVCNWPNASIAPRLTQLATNDEHPEHRIMALRALIRVAPLADTRSGAERLDLLKRAMAMSTRDTERKLILKRTRAVRTLEALRFILPYVDQPVFAEQASESVVELAHHRSLREPNKPEFDKALDKVMQISNDPTVVERAKRYKNDQTWARPIPP